MIENDLHDAIENILVYIDCDEMAICKFYLHQRMRESTLKEFSLDFLASLEKHEHSLEDNYGHIDYLKNPAWIIKYNNYYLLADGNHRINSIINNNIQDSWHYFIDLTDMPFELNI